MYVKSRISKKVLLVTAFTLVYTIRMTAQKVGKTLKNARRSLGLTQAEVADKVGISSNYYSMIERGERESPGTKIMTAIAKVLKLQPSDIITF